jgi:ArsR family transcriptional regulator
MELEQLKALADENRLAIVRLLAGGERCLCEVSSALHMSSALASHHVKRLAEAGLVETRRQGLWLHCSLASGAFTELGAELSALGASEGTAASCSCVAAEGRALDG